MQLKTIRLAATTAIISVLCAGAVFQYTALEQNNYSNAVLVMAHINE